MTQKTIKAIIGFAIISAVTILSASAQSRDQNDRKEPPTVDEIFKELEHMKTICKNRKLLQIQKK